MLGETLKKLRKEKKVTQTGLAQQLGVTQQAVGKWETGRSSPDPDTLMRLAGFFGVSTDTLLGREERLLGPVRPYIAAIETMVPVVGTVRAGYGAVAFEEDFGSAPATVRDPENYFYLVVKGDSMEPRIQSGDLALVRRQETLDDGDLGVVIYGESEGTLKRFLRKGNAVVLQPFNPEFDTVILAGEELEHLYIAGKVVETRARW
jgi:repressor LexA